MDHIDTQTLYEMVKEWTVQPWDGVQYKRISEELWDSINASNLMEGPYGDSVTLLESCIVDSTEALHAGQFTEEQAIDGLKKLLEIADFFMSARVIEVCVETNPVCRIPNINHLLKQSQSREPLKWTRRMTIASAMSFVTILGFYVVMVSLQLWEPIQLLSLLVTTSVSGIIFYSIYKLNSLTLWRAIWIFGHAGIFVMGGFILYGVFLVPFFNSVIPLSPDISYRIFAGLVSWIVIGSCMVTGGILGDRLGKRRNYRPFML